MGPAEPDETVACLVHKNTGWRDASARQSALGVRIALRKDGTAQGGWHGEGPHRETRGSSLRQWPFSPQLLEILAKGGCGVTLGPFPRAGTQSGTHSWTVGSCPI